MLFSQPIVYHYVGQVSVDSWSIADPFLVTVPYCVNQDVPGNILIKYQWGISHVPCQSGVAIYIVTIKPSGFYAVDKGQIQSYCETQTSQFPRFSSYFEETQLKNGLI